MHLCFWLALFGALIYLSMGIISSNGSWPVRKTQQGSPADTLAVAPSFRQNTFD
jgi:hypothetical protein